MRIEDGEVIPEPGDVFKRVFNSVVIVHDDGTCVIWWRLGNMVTEEINSPKVQQHTDFTEAGYLGNIQNNITEFVHSVLEEK